MKIISFVAAALLASVVAAPAYAETTERYHVADVREYGRGGRAEVRANLVRRTSIGTDGSRRHLFSVNGAYGVDTMVGTLATQSGEKPIALVDVPSDRTGFVLNGVALRQVEAARAASTTSNSAPKGCRAGTETVALPLKASGVTEDTVAVTIVYTRRQNMCLITWRAADVRATGKLAPLAFEASGATLADAAFETQAGAVAYRSISVSSDRYRGERAAFLRGSDERGALLAVREALALPAVPVGSLQRTTRLDAANAHANFASVQAASLVGAIDAAVLAYAEERTNPLPLLAAVAAFYTVDTLSATLVNGVGGGLAVIGYATNNQRLVTAGQSMLGYSGIIGESIQAGVGAIGGSRAGEVAELAYNTFTVFTPRGVSAAVGAGMVNAVGQHVLVRGGASGVGNIVIDLAAQADDANRALIYAQYGVGTAAQMLDWFGGSDIQVGTAVALDQMSQLAGGRLSPTPNPSGTMTALGFQQANQAITDPRSPFAQSLFGDVDTSSAGFADVVIGTPLSFRLFDSGNLEDGDIVSLFARGGGSRTFLETVTLTFAGRVFTPAFDTGLATISITALNEGSSPPNTGGIQVLGAILSGRSGQNYNLSSGQTGTLRVFVAGRRARQ